MSLTPEKKAKPRPESGSVIPEKTSKGEIAVEGSKKIRFDFFSFGVIRRNWTFLKFDQLFFCSSYPAAALPLPLPLAPAP